MLRVRSVSSSHPPVASHRQPHPTPRQDTGGLIISETSGVATEELLRLVEQATVAVVQKQQQHPLLSTFASLSTTEQHATMHHNASLTTSLVVPLSLVFHFSSPPCISDVMCGASSCDDARHLVLPHYFSLCKTVVCTVF